MAVHPGMKRDILRAARSRSKVTYGELMRKYHLPRGHRLSQAIAEIDRAECARGAPGFAAIIVRKDTGFPGGGYFCDDGLPPRLRRTKERRTDPKLSREERNHVVAKQRSIWDYYGKKDRYRH